jgi:putative transposase
VSTLFQPLLFLLAKCTEHQLIRQVEILKAQAEMLRERISKKRIFLRPDEKQRLMKLAEPLGPIVRYSLTVVSYSTYRRWIREQANGKPTSRMGRPRISERISETIVRIAKETGSGQAGEAIT